MVVVQALKNKEPSRPQPDCHMAEARGAESPKRKQGP